MLAAPVVSYLEEKTILLPSLNNISRLLHLASTFMDVSYCL